MSRLTRYLFFLACLLLFVAVAPPEATAGQGDPDEIVERIPPTWPLPPLPPLGPQGRPGDPDELPDGGREDDDGGGGRGGEPTLPGEGQMRGMEGWMAQVLAAMRLLFLIAY